MTAAGRFVEDSNILCLPCKTELSLNDVVVDTGTSVTYVRKFQGATFGDRMNCRQLFLPALAPCEQPAAMYHFCF